MIDGEWDLYYWPLLKTAFILTVFALLQLLSESLLVSTSVCVITIMYYQHIVALCNNKLVMSTMDQATYLSNKNSIANFMNFSTYDKENIEVLR